MNKHTESEFKHALRQSLREQPAAQDIDGSAIAFHNFADLLQIKLDEYNLTICDLRPLALRVGAKEPTVEAITEATHTASTALDVLTEVRRALRCPDDTDIVEFARRLDYFHGAPDWATVLARSCEGTGSEYAWFESFQAGARGLVRDNGHEINLPHKHAWSVVATRAEGLSGMPSEKARKAYHDVLSGAHNQARDSQDVPPVTVFKQPMEFVTASVKLPDGELSKAEQYPDCSRVDLSQYELKLNPKAQEQHDAYIKQALRAINPSKHPDSLFIQQLGRAKRPTTSAFHGSTFYPDVRVLLSEPELVVLRAADGTLIYDQPDRVQMNPDRDGLAAEVLSRITSADIAPEHIAELRAQGLV